MVVCKLGPVSALWTFCPLLVHKKSTKKSCKVDFSKSTKSPPNAINKVVIFAEYSLRTFCRLVESALFLHFLKLCYNFVESRVAKFTLSS